MNIKWTTELQPSEHINPWLRLNKPVLGKIQYQYVKDAYRLDCNNSVELVFNENFVSVEHIDSVLLEHIQSPVQYVFLIVNKFLIYTENDRLSTNLNYDLALLNHWQQITGWEPVYINYIHNDRGQVGNFVFPVTQMLLKRHEQK